MVGESIWRRRSICSWLSLATTGTSSSKNECAGTGGLLDGIANLDHARTAAGQRDADDRVRRELVLLLAVDGDHAAAGPQLDHVIGLEAPPLANGHVAHHARHDRGAHAAAALAA